MVISEQDARRRTPHESESSDEDREMIARTLLNAMEEILRISRKNNVPIMFMGGIAVSAWGIPRATYDIDGIIQIDSEKLCKFLNSLSLKGFTYNKKEPVRVIKNLSFITLCHRMQKQKLYIDLFLVQSEYGKNALQRSKKITLNKLRVPIISPEDLILYKLLAGRTRDLEDVRNILLMQKEKLDTGYMKRWAKRLGISVFLKDELDSAYGKTRT